MGYRFPEETMKKLVEDGKILFGEDESKIIELKVYAKDFRAKLSSLITIDGRLGAYELRNIFPEMKKTFDNPKPKDLIKELASFTTGEGDIVLDFFAGAGTTAESIIELNKEDGGERKFILVQLPEPIDDSAINLQSISEICADRIRRVIKKLEGERSSQFNFESDTSTDLGFRVFKLARSNFKVWEGDVEAIQNLEQRLFEHIDHINAASMPEGILYELLLKSGFPLTTKVKTLELAGKQVFSIEDERWSCDFGPAAKVD